MPYPRSIFACGLIGLLAFAASCAPDDAPPGGDIAAAREGLTDPEARRERAALIRDAAADEGLTNGLLLAGIADNETSMSHCWSELTWACMGPSSPDCGGEAVVAGAADGPCSDMEGGLGMFQFDAGTYSDTLEREGDRILTIAGNTAAAVDFVVDMVIRSTYIDGVETESDALAWMNEVRVDNDKYHPWIQTVTHYYNGCVPGSCSVYDSRYENYSSGPIGLLDEMGVDFWYGDVSTPECTSIPADGRVVDDSGPCFEDGGTSTYWRYETAGYDGSLQWTHTTDSDAVDNFGVWSLAFDEAGTYRVEVYTDAGFAQARQAAYRVTHAGVTDVAMLDQSAADGWQVLGDFDFAAGGDQQIRLEDNTGEPYSTRTQIVFDAIRVTGEGGDPPGDGGTDADGGIGGDAGPTGDAGTGRPMGKAGGGCSVTHDSTHLEWALLALALGAALMARRRRG